LYGDGHSIEFVATFIADRFQSVGFMDLRNSNVQALFTTFFGGVFYVRSNKDAGNSISTSLPRFWLGSPHRYRIDWTTGGVVFSIRTSSPPIQLRRLS
jgi:hypothetical protein